MAEFKVEHKKQQSSEHGAVSQRKGETVLPDNRGQVSQARALTDNRAVQLAPDTTSKPNNTGLPNQLKSGIESLSGMNMDHVKVHYNSSQPAQLNAHAYAQGSDIHVAPGQEKHLPHEAWHVVQQAQGRVRPTVQMKGGVPVNDNVGLEHEADVMGEKALKTESSQLEPQQLRKMPVAHASVAIQRYFDVFGNWVEDGNSSYGQPFSYSPLFTPNSFSYSSRSKKSSSGRDTSSKNKGVKFVNVELIGKKRREREMQRQKDRRQKTLNERRNQISGSYLEIIEQTQWRKEIESKNPAVLEPEIYKEDWYLMPYTDILAEESEAVMATLQSWFPTSPTDTQYLAQIYNEPNLQKAHPLVTSFNPHLENDTLALQFSINPTYIKYLDTSGKKLALRIGGGTNAITGLAVHETDVLFKPQTISVNGTSTEVGYMMHARRLSQDHPLGMTAAKDSKQETLMHDLAKSGGSANTMYIKGHLLNDHLGGPARTENLFPITQEANGQHVYWVEKYVKAEIAKGYVMEYSVEVPGYTISGPTYGSTRNGYTINSTFKCHSARIDVGGKPIDSYNITIVSSWGAAAKPLYNDTTPVDDPATISELVNKLASGTPNKGKTNADVKDVDTSTYAKYLKPGYSQSTMASGTHSGVTLQDHHGALPFSLSGIKSKISAATKADLEGVVGKHKANLIFAAISKVGAQSDKPALLAIHGIGLKTVDALDKEFDLS